MTTRRFSTIDYEVSNGVALVTLDRPEAKNAFNAAMLADLLAAFDATDANDNVRAVILTGAGRVFCAGADLKEGFGVGGGEGEAFRDRGGQVSLRIQASTKPVIAVVNGAAAGAGAAMLLACDLRIVVPEAKWLFPYVRLGLAPEGCVSWYLPRLVGVGRALEWLLWGRTIDAQEAMSAGLVSAILPLDEAMTMARERAEVLAATAPVSVALVRNMLWRGAGAEDVHAIHLAESRLIPHRRHSPDAVEGVAAFREKRSPKFPQSISRDLAAALDA